MGYPHTGAQNFLQNLLQRPRIGILRRPGTGSAGRCFIALPGLVLCDPFGIAYIQTILDNLPGHSLRISNRQQRPGVTRRQITIIDQLLNGLWQFQQAQRIRHMASTFPNNFCQVILRVAEILHELIIPHCFLNRVQVCSLNIFNDGEFERKLVISFDDNNGNIRQPGPLGRPPAALASDQFKYVWQIGQLPDDDRLDNAAFRDRGGKLLKIALREVPPRIAGIGTNKLNGDATLPTNVTGVAQRHIITGFANQGRQAAAKPRARFIRHF